MTIVTIGPQRVDMQTKKVSRTLTCNEDEVIKIQEGGQFNYFIAVYDKEGNWIRTLVWLPKSKTIVFFD